jgi:hypothetical protein
LVVLTLKILKSRFSSKENAGTTSICEDYP